MAKLNGSPVTFVATKPLQISAGATRAVVTSEAVADGSPDLRLKIVAQVEFDGFARVDLQLKGTSAESLDRFWFEIPMTRLNASFSPARAAQRSDDCLPRDSPRRSSTRSISSICRVMWWGRDRPDTSGTTAPIWTDCTGSAATSVASFGRPRATATGWSSRDRWKAQTLSFEGDNLIRRLHFVDDMPRRDGQAAELDLLLPSNARDGPLPIGTACGSPAGRPEYKDLRGSRHPMLQSAHDAGVKITGVHKRRTEGDELPLAPQHTRRNSLR